METCPHGRVRKITECLECEQYEADAEIARLSAELDAAYDRIERYGAEPEPCPGRRTSGLDIAADPEAEEEDCQEGLDWGGCRACLRRAGG